MNNLNFIKETIYHLKMEYGGKITIRRETATTDDITTGVVSTNNVEVIIQHAIRLPDRMLRQSFKHFVIASSFDKNERTFIIDADDLTTAYGEPQQGDIILIDGGSLRYKIKEVKEMDYQIAYVVSATTVEGDTE
jgi:hypothetical protein